MVTSKSIVADLNEDENFIGDNYEIWHRKVQLALTKFEVFEVLNHIVNPPNPNSPRREIKIYEKWKKKHSLARITILSAMHNNLLYE